MRNSVFLVKIRLKVVRTQHNSCSFGQGRFTSKRDMAFVLLVVRETRLNINKFIELSPIHVSFYVLGSTHFLILLTGVIFNTVKRWSSIVAGKSEPKYYWLKACSVQVNESLFLVNVAPYSVPKEKCYLNHFFCDTLYRHSTHLLLDNGWGMNSILIVVYTPFNGR